MNLIRAYLKAKDRGVSADEFIRHVGVDGRLIESLDGSNSSLREEFTSGERAIVEAAAVRPGKPGNLGCKSQRRTGCGDTRRPPRARASSVIGPCKRRPTAAS